MMAGAPNGHDGRFCRAHCSRHRARGPAAGDAGWHYRMFYPSADIVQEATSEAGLVARPGSFHIPSVHDRQIFERIELLHHLSRSQHAEAMQIETLFIELMTLALHRHAGTAMASSPSHHRVGLGVARQLIEDGFELAPSLDALARAAGLSKFEFVRQFRGQFGLPPHAYLRLVRVRRARDHISAGGALADCAMACGFADQAHMTRAFVVSSASRLASSRGCAADAPIHRLSRNGVQNLFRATE